jgi:hypothetical protein
VANIIKNGESTQFRSGSEAVENGRKGGVASGKARREQKTIQTLLQDYLANDVKSNKALLPLADKAGIKGNQSIKELVTAVCIINTLKKGDVDKLGKLVELLGEESMLAEIEDLTEIEEQVFGNG